MADRAERRQRQQGGPWQRVNPVDRHPELQIHRPLSDNEPVRGGGGTAAFFFRARPARLATSRDISPGGSVRHTCLFAYSRRARTQLVRSMGSDRRAKKD